MTFTYSSTSIATDLAKVRLEIQDVTSTSPLFTDEEINSFLDSEGSVLGAAARAAEVVSRKYAHDFNWKADGDEVDRVARAKMWAELAVSLRRRAAGTIRSRQTVNRDGWQPVALERDHADRDSLSLLAVEDV